MLIALNIILFKNTRLSMRVLEKTRVYCSLRYTTKIDKYRKYSLKNVI